jgi:DNA-binding NarL/FixJ family response regulator
MASLNFTGTSRSADPSGKSIVPRICIVDDDENIHIFLKDLADLGHFKLADSFYTAAQALDRLPEIRPDAAIMDIRLPDLSGIECTVRLKTVLPELPIIIVTGFADAQSFVRSLMAGAKGFLVKPVSAQEFLTAIGDVLRGDFALAKTVVPFLIQIVHHVREVTRESRLTRREEEILACLFQGMQDKEIASTLGIGTATVHTHMHRLFEKLGVHSRREIIAKYLNIN